MTAIAANSWLVKALTLFPEMFPGPLGCSLAGQALKNGLWSLETVDIRQFASDKHRSVDDAPFGGGPGMVMRADVAYAAIEAASQGAAALPLIYLTPRGIPLTQKRVLELARGPGMIILCGRFEGVDQRVLEERSAEELSIGDFVLSGGEPAAIALIDASVRLLPGALGQEASLREESFGKGLLEYPHYTRPRTWKGMEAPEALISGHHEKIQAWRLDQAEKITRTRRPDLWARYVDSRKGCPT